MRAPSSECRAVPVLRPARRREEQAPAHWRSTPSSTPGLHPPARACTGGIAGVQRWAGPLSGQAGRGIERPTTDLCSHLCYIAQLGFVVL